MCGVRKLQTEGGAGAASTDAAACKESLRWCKIICTIFYYMLQ